MDYKLEPPEDIVSCYCDECGREILVGEDYYHFEYDMICEDCIYSFKFQERGLTPPSLEGIRF